MGESGSADLPHCIFRFVLEDLQGPGHAPISTGAQAVKRRSSTKEEVGP